MHSITFYFLDGVFEVDLLRQLDSTEIASKPIERGNLFFKMSVVGRLMDYK